ncbi:MAG: DUF4838 domain-containing protein [Candidatus Latescibacteria bacterium]|nr:DUF4838 domain-containing protein [Candidatus Latescibacterota bacterium]
MLIVREGKAASRIAVTKEASGTELFAARELQAYIEKISGVQLEITRGNPDETQNSVFVGCKEKIDQDKFREAFEIEATEHSLLLVGCNPRSVLFCVYTFLEEYLGCRWFAPGVEGEDIPRQKTIEIELGFRSYTPSMVYRGMMIGMRAITEKDVEDWIDWMAKNRLNYCNILSWHWDSMPETLRKKLISEIERRDMIWDFGHHSFHYFISYHFNRGSQAENCKAWFKQHPEQSALKDGKRLPPEAEGQLCLTDSGVFETIVRNIKSFIREYPKVDIITLMPNDSVKWCECPKCRKSDSQGQESGFLKWIYEKTGPSHSERYFRFLNKVAREIGKEYPDKLMKARCYIDFTDKPTNIRLDNNILVNIDLYWRDYSTYLYEPKNSKNKYFVSVLKDWLKEQDPKHILVSEYLMGMYGNISLPFHLRHLLAKEIPYLVKLGIGGITTQAEINNFYTYGLNYYFMAKLSWNPKQDIDDLLQDYCHIFYGPAAEPMKGYFVTLERAMLKVKGYLGPAGIDSFRKRFPDRNIFRTLRRYVAQAQELASEKKYKERVNLSRISIDYTELFWRGIQCRIKGEQALHLSKFRQAERSFREGVDIGEELLDMTIRVKTMRVLQIDNKYPYKAIASSFLDACRRGLYQARIKYSREFVNMLVNPE